MAASKSEIQKWIKKAKNDDCSHLLVICDAFDYMDYPVYVNKNQNINTIVKIYRNKNMNRIMEIYDLNKDISEQINEIRCWNI